MDMGIVVDHQRLRWEIARRGWSAADLVRASGVSGPTISAALAGRPVAARSLGKIAEALGRAPALPVVEALLVPPPGETDLT